MRPIAITCALSLVVPGVYLPWIASAEAQSSQARESGWEQPLLLSETGLYEKGSLTVRQENLPYAPQYTLWADGATKRRWVYLPPGSVIDASDADAWVFPVGTRFWKEFGYAGPIETRMIERLVDGSWRYSAYVWNEEGSDAYLAPESGYRRHRTPLAPAGFYTIPSRDDCRACHEGNAVPILGVSALQLSPDRDALAPNAERKPANAIDLDDFTARKLLGGLTVDFENNPPRIPATSPTERAALGYLHANCGHCHNETGPLNDLNLNLAQGVAAETAGRVFRSLVDVPSDFHLYGATRRVVPGQPALSVLALRMRSRNPVAQMPPLGTRAVDTQAMALIERWIQESFE